MSLVQSIEGLIAELKVRMKDYPGHQHWFAWDNELFDLQNALNAHYATITDDPVFGIADRLDGIADAFAVTNKRDEAVKIRQVAHDLRVAYASGQ